MDTRLITRELAAKGALKAAIINFGKNKFDLEEVKKNINDWKGLENLDLASVVSTKNNYKSNQSIWNLKNNNYTINNKKEFKITCLDFGIKNNILRELNNKFSSFFYKV